MSNADADTAGCRGSNQFQGSIQFRSDRQHANTASRCLPESFKSLDFRGQKIVGGMDTSSCVTDEGSLQMNAQRPGSSGEARSCLGRVGFGEWQVLLFRVFDRVGETLERAQRIVDGSGDRGREISGNSMSREEALNCG